MTNWILIVWLVNSANSLELIKIDHFETEQECIATMVQLDMEPSWIASCVPEKTNEDIPTSI